MLAGLRVLVVAFSGAAVVGWGTGCRDVEPPRPYYRDLGTESRPLPPTSGPWHDLAVKDGKATWHPFRELRDEDVADAAGGEAAGEESAVAAEIRELLAEYSELIAKKDYEAAIEFFIEDQADAVRKLVETLPTLIEKLSALGDALAEAAPVADRGLSERLKSVTVSEVLALEVESLRAVSDKKAVGKPPAGRLASPLWPATGTPETPHEIRFEFDENEEYWFIDAPAIAALAARLPALQQALPQLDALVNGLKSGQLRSDALADELAELGKVFWPSMPSGAQDDQGDDTQDSEKNAASTDDGRGE